MTTGDKAELLPCPVCKHPMTYEPYDPNSWISPPDHYECGKCGTIVQSKGIAILQAAGVSGVPEARPLEEWHEDMGDVLWWKFPITEAPYVGSPICLGQTVEITMKAYGVEETMRVNVGGWPGYHTHFTPIPLAAAPER